MNEKKMENNIPPWTSSAEVRKQMTERAEAMADGKCFAESRQIALRAEGAINALDVSGPRILELESALKVLLSETPTSLSCDDFHHYPGDQHSYGEACPPKMRHIAALEQAQDALARRYGDRTK